MSTPPYCSLFCVLADEAPVGIIFRRGPSKQVQLIRWNTDDDTLEAGQWLKGQIKGWHASLSPDGRYLVYNAFNGWESYSVISRPPYLTALAIWFSQSTYEMSGGRFASNDELWVGEGVAARIEFRADRLRCPFTIRTPTAEEGVALHQRRFVPFRNKGRPHPASGLRLWITEREPFAPKRLDAQIRWQEFEHALLGLDWVDFDHRGRLVYAHDGCLYRVGPTVEGTFVTQKLADFNENVFTPVEAPDWARSW